MEEDRARKVKRRLEHATERRSDVLAWTRGMGQRAFSEDKKTRLATYKAVQEIAEAATDVCALMLKEEGLVVEDDYQNIGKLLRRGLLSKETAKLLKELNGLRNRLVHEYAGTEHQTAFFSIQRLVPKVKRFEGEVRQWLKAKA